MSKVVVLISGGNSGIGYEIVKKLALDCPESHQILMGTRDLEKGESALKSMGAPANVSPIQLDITQDSSIDKAFESIKTNYGKLDVLINNAGTAGLDLGIQLDNGTLKLPEGTPLREVYEHVYQVNVVSTAILTEKMTPLLEKASLPKIIFISSTLGSLNMLTNSSAVRPWLWYSSSKSALNHLCIWYSKKYPHWKVNSCCPGYVATGLNHLQRNEATHPRTGAINVCRLVMEDQDGCSGTFSNRFQTLPW